MGDRDYKTGGRPLFGQGNALTSLVVLNIVVFVLINFIRIIYLFSYSDSGEAEIAFSQQVMPHFMLPASFDQLLSRPWTIILYMFSHYSIWSLISSLLWLWAFGFILQDLTGNKKLVPIYLYGGFVGAIFFLLSVNFIPAIHHTITANPSFMGGGAAVMAVAIATTTLSPNYRLFPMINGGIPLWVLALIFVAVDFTTLSGSSGGYAIAHLAGGLMGFLFTHQLKAGKDLGMWMNQLLDWLDGLFNPEKKDKGTPGGRLFYKSPGKPFQKKANLTQQKLDAILDKINQEGYDALTGEEKNFLKQASKEDL